ncbi:MAG: maleylpyruvate isomerase N-terminal domain-containing protein [Chloroflexi bacterium]|nr:maleylpyruvate isomerase N-terminal domain-containing protein [Chloroflexota bacterium]
MILEPQDLMAVGRTCTAALLPASDADWSVKAGDLDWDCRQTLEHMLSSSSFYAINLAMRSTSRIRGARSAEPNASIGDLIALLEPSVTVLARVAEAAPPGARGHHPAGMADAEGFLAMACNEQLVHAYDVARGLKLDFQPPAELVSKTLRRLYPWAPTDREPWPTLLWAAGRAPLGDRPRQDADWFVQCAPLSEWDGTVKRRVLPRGAPNR